jgi:hypothetical protein
MSRKSATLAARLRRTSPASMKNVTEAVHEPDRERVQRVTRS